MICGHCLIRHRCWYLRSAAVFCLLLAGCGVPGPGGQADSFGLDLRMPAGSQAHGAVIFFVDGVNAEIFQKMLEANELPAIQKYFVERGLYAPRAVANIPSVTLANMTSFVTGRFPGHHGVTGINWFDRNQLIWRNYESIAQKNTLDGDYISPNIYDGFGGESTFSLFFQPHRGSTKFIENWTSAGPPFFFGWFEFVDRLTLWRLNIVADVARKRHAWPAITIVYLLAPDFRGYGCGVGSEQYRRALRHTDRQIGRVCGDLDRAGLLEKLTLVLTSDHGLDAVKRHFPLEKFLRREGLKIAPARLWEETPFEKRLDHYRKYPVVLYGSGDRYWAICLRKPIRTGGKLLGYRPWPIRPDAEDLKAYPVAGTDVDLLALLTDQPAVDAVAYAVGPNRVRLRRKNGEVEFCQDGGQGGQISYRLICGTDPLGWTAVVHKEAMDGQPLTGRQWLEATAETEFPDLPAQILAYFRARRAGDIAVFAAPGWDFFNVNRAGHGGLRPADMHVPLLIAGHGAAKGRLKTARTADVMPTLLKLLGRPVPEGVDGKALLPAR
ncbi:MAG: alkaline phosphatase family protein [Planctomycetota bacterium]|nr:alkaline phosphatase family protein [Planctomycetota bacterium]